MNYLIRRVILSVPVVAIVSIVVFAMIFLSGDPAVLMLPPELSEEEVARFRHAYGFDDPFLVQYGRFIGKALKGDFGKSLRYNQPAINLVLERLPATLQLSTFAMLLAVLFSIPLGIIAALKRNSIVDYISSFLAVIGQSMPNYWLGFLLVYLLSI